MLHKPPCAAPPTFALISVQDAAVAGARAVVATFRQLGDSIDIKEKGATMSDDLSNVGGADRARINVNEQHELRYWTEALGVDETVLREAVQAVGVSANDVRDYLKNK